MALSASSLAENQPSGTSIGLLNTSDADAADTFTYSLVNGGASCPGTDNTSFQIGIGSLSDQLQSAEPFDYETKNSYTICIRTTDSASNTFDKQFTITVLDADDPSLSIDNVAIAEGNSGTANAVFTVSLSSSTGFVVAVDFATADGTATAGSDYVSNSSTLTFSAGETSKTISVEINGDILNESDETFTVHLSNPANATIATATGTGTIQNNDGTPIVSIDDVALPEGDTGVTNAVFTVTLPNPSSQNVTVDFSTADGTASAGSDYTASSGTLTFNPDETAKTITVLVTTDTDIEPDETFTVNLSNPTNATIANTTGTGTIQNDDAVITRRYAKPGALTSGTCNSWATACELRYALSIAVSGQEIWVKAGTYKPTSGIDRSATFTLKNGVAIYGGFAGTENMLSQRDPVDPDITTLSGDIGTAGDASDNSW